MIKNQNYIFALLLVVYGCRDLSLDNYYNQTHPSHDPSDFCMLRTYLNPLRKQALHMADINQNKHNANYKP